MSFDEKRQFLIFFLSFFKILYKSTGGRGLKKLWRNEIEKVHVKKYIFAKVQSTRYLGLSLIEKNDQIFSHNYIIFREV